MAFTTIVRHVPPARLQQVIRAAGREQRRDRLLPAWIVAYTVMAVEVMPSPSYARALSLVHDVLLDGNSGGPCRRQPTDSALVRARQRLGVEPFQLLLANLSEAVLSEQLDWGPCTIAPTEVSGPALAGGGPPWVVREGTGRLLAAGLTAADQSVVREMASVTWSSQSDHEVLPRRSRRPDLIAQDAAAHLCVQLARSAEIGTVRHAVWNDLKST